ncbi:MAG TPA: exodeoxyribonuclease VII large subunit, partial [Gammaproteobacteria bacterium]|nr:exodeoxyribonuclease VII large subunit [Gammaproteobacteria bacterium]
MQTLAFSPVSTRDIYSVTRLNREVRAILEGNFPALWIEGEISNLSRPASGHLYFSLKDAQCQVRCAMFRSRNWLLHFTPENGLHVVVRAEVSLYEGRGEFQLLVQHMEPAGDGALRLAFERLKQKLYAEGLFSEAHKIGIPAIPRAIGVITSPTGAAIRDILSIL